jgi:hypothetical protein
VRKLWSFFVPEKQKDLECSGHPDVEAYWEIWCEPGWEQDLQPSSPEVDTFWTVWADPADSAGAIRTKTRAKQPDPLDVRVAKMVCAMQKAKLEQQVAFEAAEKSTADVTDAYIFWDAWASDVQWPCEHTTQPEVDLYWSAWADATPEPERSPRPSKFEEAHTYWAAWEDKVETPTETYWTAWLDEANEATHYWTAW